MPKARRLPAELRGLATRNGWPVSDATYQTDMAALIAEVAREVHAMNPAAWPDASEAGHLPCVRCPKRSLAAVEASAFAAIQRFAMNPYGYDVEEVNAGLVGMLGRMSDPERCIGLRSPYFRWSSRSGYDREQVNTFLEKHRLPPVRFEQGVRRILADHGVLLSLFPAAVEHAQLAHPQLGTDEELLGLIVLRSHRTMPEMLAFTNTSIIGLLRTMRFQVQYQDMADLVVAARRWDEPLGANEFTGIPTYSELKVTYRGSSTTLPREELKWVGGVDALAEAVVSDLRGLLQRFGGQTEGAEMDLTTMSLRRRPSR